MIVQLCSLASLITFREYTRKNPGRAGYYIRRFSAFNFGFLIIMLITALLLVAYIPQITLFLPTVWS